MNDDEPDRTPSTTSATDRPPPAGSSSTGLSTPDAMQDSRRRSVLSIEVQQRPSTPGRRSRSSRPAGNGDGGDEPGGGATAVVRRSDPVGGTAGQVLAPARAPADEGGEAGEGGRADESSGTRERSESDQSSGASEIRTAGDSGDDAGTDDAENGTAVPDGVGTAGTPDQGRPPSARDGAALPAGHRPATDRSATGPPTGAVAGRTRRMWVRSAAATVLIALVLVGGGLAYAGSRIVRNSTQGEVFAPVSDPTEPGYEAYLEPTPTMVVLHSKDGLIESATFLSLPGRDEGGGAVVFVPVRTVTDLGVLGTEAIEYAYDLGGPEQERQAIQTLLGTGIGELAQIDAERWADLVGPVAPIAIDNPDVIRSDDDEAGEILFDEGMIELEADEVGPYLEARVEGESDLARLFRHQVFWRAWIEAVAADGTVEAVPGETDNGIGRFVRLLAEDATTFETLPVVETDEPIDRVGTGFVPDQDAMDALMAELVPFPTSPAPGVRQRVRVLNGTADTDRASEVASLLPPLGAEIELVGNARTFGLDTSISYFGDEAFEVATEIRGLLGVGELVEEERPSEVVDITVILGEDYESL